MGSIVDWMVGLWEVLLIGWLVCGSIVDWMVGMWKYC